MALTKHTWNSLEVAKLLASLIMPVVVALVGFYLATIQQDASKQAAVAFEKGTRQYQKTQEAQAQRFQKQLAVSNQNLSRQLQQADLQSRLELQATELRWQKLLQDEGTRRSEEARRVELQKASEVRDADVRRMDAQQRQELERERKDSVADFSRSISDRRIRSVLLASGLRRGDAGSSSAADQEITARKARYDDAFARWNTDVHVNMFRIRRVLGTKEYTFLEGVVEQRLSAGLFAATDACLTEAYDTSVAGGKAGPVLKECGMTVLLQATLDCGYVISDLLFRLASSSIDFDLAQRMIDQRCPERTWNSTRGGGDGTAPTVDAVRATFESRYLACGRSAITCFATEDEPVFYSTVSPAFRSARSARLTRLTLRVDAQHFEKIFF